MWFGADLHRNNGALAAQTGAEHPQPLSIEKLRHQFTRACMPARISSATSGREIMRTSGSAQYHGYRRRGRGAYGKSTCIYLSLQGLCPKTIVNLHDLRRMFTKHFEIASWRCVPCRADLTRPFARSCHTHPCEPGHKTGMRKRGWNQDQQFSMPALQRQTGTA